MNRRKLGIQFVGCLCLLSWFFSFTLWDQTPDQREKHLRVQRAKAENDRRLQILFQSKQLPYPPENIFLRAFKKEKELELWVMSATRSYTLLKSYPFCSTSGVLGPKRRQGDLQIPEGCYHVDRFNPWSRFYLSLGISYPNRSDRIRGDRQNPGGDIFIHGSCVTIGCIPITDEKIKELYWLSLLARRNGQTHIPVHIFPAKMDPANFRILCSQASDPVFWARFKEFTGKNHPRTPRQLIEFWENLKVIYDHFEKTRQLAPIHIDGQGYYRMETDIRPE